MIVKASHKADPDSKSRFRDWRNGLYFSMGEVAKNLRPFLIYHRVGDEKVYVVNIYYSPFNKYHNEEEKRTMVVVSEHRGFREGLF